MTLIVLYAATLIIFLGLDAIALNYLIGSIFRREIGPLLLDNFRFLPAMAFYMFYIGGVLWFVSWPALMHDKSLLWVFGSAALLGAMAYGTYEFTNLATLRDWRWNMVVADLTWGTVLSGVAATGGLALTRMMG